MNSSPTRPTERLTLTKTAELLLDECRMVLPGIQALLGFQLIVVFSAAFDEKLGPTQQRLHLLAIALIAVAVAIVMAPAAYNRQTELHDVSEAFIRISTRLLLWSMLPLALGICLDFYLIAGIILPRAAGMVATGLFVVFVTLWVLLPRLRLLQGLLGAGPTETT